MRNSVAFFSTVLLIPFAFVAGLAVGSAECEPVHEENLYENMYYEPMWDRDEIVEEAAWRASQFEGFSSEPYELWGTWHIGYGTLISGPDAVTHVSEQVAYDIMLGDLYNMHDTLSMQWPAWEDLLPEYQVVLVDMAYNMGIPRLMGFTQLQECKTLDCIEREITDSHYYEQVTSRAEANIHYVAHGE